MTKEFSFKVFDSGKFHATNLKVEEIYANSVTINGKKYSRKGEKLVGRVVAIVISSDLKHMIGHSFPIYA